MKSVSVKSERVRPVPTTTNETGADCFSAKQEKVRLMIDERIEQRIILARKVHMVMAFRDGDFPNFQDHPNIFPSKIIQEFLNNNPSEEDQKKSLDEMIENLYKLNKPVL